MEGTDKFSLKFGSMPTKKKFSPQITLRGFGPFASFLVTILALRGARSQPGGERRKLMVRISVLAHKCGDQKKGCSKCCRRSFSRAFHPGTKVYSHLGGHRPQNAPQWHQAVSFLWGAILARGAQAVISGARPLVVPGLSSRVYQLWVNVTNFHKVFQKVVKPLN